MLVCTVIEEVTSFNKESSDDFKEKKSLKKMSEVEKCEKRQKCPKLNDSQ